MGRLTKGEDSLGLGAVSPLLPVVLMAGRVLLGGRGGGPVGRSGAGGGGTKVAGRRSGGRGDRVGAEGEVEGGVW